MPNRIQQESDRNPLGTLPTGILWAPNESLQNSTRVLAMEPTGVLLESGRDVSYWNHVGALSDRNWLETQLDYT
eukprot:4990499-Pyramimonas_sp.AAC.1